MTDYRTIATIVCAEDNGRCNRKIARIKAGVEADGREHLYVIPVNFA